MKRPSSKRFNVFIGFYETAGYYHQLTQALRQNGHSVSLITLTGHRFDYGKDDKHTLFGRWLHHVYNRKYTRPEFLTQAISHFRQTRIFQKLPIEDHRWFKKLFSKAWLPFRRSAFELEKTFKQWLWGFYSSSAIDWHRNCWYAWQTLLKTLLLGWALATHDVFIFSGQGTFLPHFQDLPLLKIFGKRIIGVFNGSDSRPAYMSTTYQRFETWHECIDYVHQQKHKITTLEAHADYLINHPAHAQFHEKPFVAALFLGIPFTPPASVTHSPHASSEKVRILHCPSNPEAKGSPRIRQIIDELKADGLAIDYTELSGQPNTVVLEHIRQCDFVIDQLYTDMPLAGFATEAAYFGKPAVVSGYYADQIKQDYPAHVLPPTMYCHPNDVKDTVRTFITQAEYRESMGQQVQTFLTNQWRVEQIVERYEHLMHGTAPEEWLFNPQQIDYIHGWGLHENQLKTNLQHMLAHGTLADLALSDKPHLETRLLALLENVSVAASSEAIVS